MSRWSIIATWEDAPHLTAEQKQDLWDQLPPFQRVARAQGIPTLGIGAVYPIEETRLIVDPFAIPPYWPRCYGMDVGWNNTAAIWAAVDPDTDTVYFYHEYKISHQEPAVHVAAIKRLDVEHGVIDPASRGRSQADGQQLLVQYRQQGLDVIPADNAVENGVFAVYRRMSEGSLKIFKTLHLTLAELRLYHRDEKGKIVKKDDHLLDALRYTITSGLYRASVPFEEEPEQSSHYHSEGRSAVTGY